MNYFELENGVKIPEIGLGVFRFENNEQGQKSIISALNSGYRHLDTAMFYGNEECVGQSIAESDVKREDIFVTTKLWNEDIKNGNIRPAFEESLRKLNLEYIDLYLIHWPAEGFVHAWQVMEELYKEGKIRAIGVSNFHKFHLDEVYKVCTIRPMVNQIESNPYFNNQELIDYCKSEGMVVEAWSPLGGIKTRIFDDVVLNKIAKKYDKCVAQIIVKWNVQRGVCVLPKSSNPDRIKANIDVYDFTLTDEEICAINELNKNTRSGGNPDTYTIF